MKRSGGFPPDPHSYGEQSMTNFDRLIEELQQQIDEKEHALYSAEVIEQANNPENLRRLEQADCFAIVTGWCGDAMEFRFEKPRL